MKSMVVLFALASVACGSLLPLAQPPHHPALVLDPHGRPLDTAEVIGARALHLQAKALEHAPLAHAVVAPAVLAAPAHSVVATPLHGANSLLGAHSLIGAHSLLSAHSGLGHLLKKRSLGYSLSPVAYAIPAAVSHQSRVDVISSPAVVAHAVTAPVVSHAVAPVLTHAIAPAAVSHQSRVDVHSSPAVIAHSVAGAPLHSAHSLLGAQSLVGAHSLLGAHSGLGHLLKKRSLGYSLAPVAHAIPAAVSHQSRVDVISNPAVVAHALAAPIVAHAIAPVAVSHQSRVDVHSSPAVIAHSVLATPAHSVVAAPLHGIHSLLGAHSLVGAHSLLGAHSGHGHLLKKRSLGYSLATVVHAVPAAVSHQSRVDVISSPAVVAHAAPLALSAAWTAPLSHLSHHGLLHSTPLAHAAHW